MDKSILAIKDFDTNQINTFEGIPLEFEIGSKDSSYKYTYYSPIPSSGTKVSEQLNDLSGLINKFSKTFIEFRSKVTSINQNYEDLYIYALDIDYLFNCIIFNLVRLIDKYHEVSFEGLKIIFLIVIDDVIKCYEEFIPKVTEVLSTFIKNSLTTAEIYMTLLKQVNADCNIEQYTAFLLTLSAEHIMMIKSFKNMQLGINKPIIEKPVSKLNLTLIILVTTILNIICFFLFNLYKT